MAGDRETEALPGRDADEALLLALVALVALSPLYPVNDGQDVSRSASPRPSCTRGSAQTGCLVAPLAVDRSSYAATSTPDKAPGSRCRGSHRPSP